MLASTYTVDKIEAGCDEAGRGCLAGPVFAGAVIFPKGYTNKELNDSKQLNKTERYALRNIIEKDALCWAVAKVNPEEIDEINILNASYLAMHRAIDQLVVRPELLLIDGNRFKPYKNIPHVCMIKGDGRFISIAAASILSKTYRDDYMVDLHQHFPHYHWNSNKGYPTIQHKLAIQEFGLCSHHRRTFNSSLQLKIGF
jgi:ribonuclease HII